MMEEDDVKLNAINAGPATTDCMACQCKYNTIRCRNSKEVGWSALGADCVCKSTGIFLTKKTAEAIIYGGAKKVFSSATTKDDSRVVVTGVNADKYDGSKNFVLCVSCTTHGLGPMVGRVGKPHRVGPVCWRPALAGLSGRRGGGGTGAGPSGSDRGCFGRRRRPRWQGQETS